MKIENDRVRECLERLSDPTGTARRYAESLQGKPTWEEELKSTQQEGK